MTIDLTQPAFTLDRRKNISHVRRESIGKKMFGSALRFEAYMTKKASTESELAHAAFRGDIPSDVTHILEQTGALEENWRDR